MKHAQRQRGWWGVLFQAGAYNRVCVELDQAKRAANRALAEAEKQATLVAVLQARLATANTRAQIWQVAAGEWEKTAHTEANRADNNGVEAADWRLLAETRLAS